MKLLTDRKEIAQAMNFGKYPVVRIDVETPKAGWDDVFEGDLVRVESQSKRYPGSYIRGRVMKYPEDGERYSIMPETVCLHNDFGYGDVIEMLGYAQAPMLHAGETVVVIEDAPKQRAVRVRMMRVSDSVRDFVYPTCYLEYEKEEN